MKARVINIIIWSVIAVALIVLVVKGWGADGASVTSMLAGCGFYTALCSGLAIVIDQTIKEAQQ